MKTNGSTRDYNNGQKNNARRWGWNQTIQRTAGAEKTDPSIVLAGRDFRDREIAISKGVPSINILGVDHFQTNVNRARRAGGIAFCADIVKTLTTWPADRPVAAVVLDFCHGLEATTMKGILHALARQPFAHTSLWLNMQRGRDASSNDARATLTRLFGGRPLPIIGDLGLNRAHHFFLIMVVARLVRDLDRGRLDPRSRVADYIEYVNWLHGGAAFRSYDSITIDKTGRRITNVFDSIVIHPQPQRTLGRYTPEQKYKTIEHHLSASADATTRRLITAALAVRTMRADR